MQKTYYNYWGKADKEGNYHLLPYHCLDVAAVGEVYLYENHGVLGKFSNLLNLEQESFQKLMIFFLGLHDLGKFSDAFQGLICSKLPEIYAKLFPENKTCKPYSLRHDSIGYIYWYDELKSILKDKDFFNKSNLTDKEMKKFIYGNDSCFDILFRASNGHHGTPPNLERNSESKFYLKANMEAANNFTFDFYQLIFTDVQLKLPTDIKEFYLSLKSNSYWIAGLFTLCDWIGSNTRHFKYKNDDKFLSLKEYWEMIAIPSAKTAIKESGILPSKLSILKSYKDLFPFEIKEFTPIQKFVSEMEVHSGAGLYILEDVTGAGKTEASLILAKRLMDINHSEGVFIGLPTMATANAMYDRIKDAYRNFYTNSPIPSLVLAHGKRELSEKFKNTILDSNTIDQNYSKEDASASAICNSWIADNKKKTFLASFGVGTIDQALVSILYSKYQSLRLIGLFNKVIILDEIHAYDTYMNELISKLLEFHASIGGSVILLSATMPAILKKQFIESFQRGIKKESEDILIKANEYPLVTYVSVEELEEFPVNSRQEVIRTVSINFLHDIDQILSFIKDTIDSGKCICWIRNTVTDAIHACELIQARLSIEPILFHARFMIGDRIEIENKVLEQFGKKSKQEVRKGKILVATQVVEQSLDLDFDEMITDIAPIDLIIQRAGRLHRHVRNTLGNLKEEGSDERNLPTLHIHSPEFIANPEKDWFQSKFPNASFVYEDHSEVWLTMKSLIEKREFKMPDDARFLIESVYGENLEIPEALNQIRQKVKGKLKKAASLGELNTLDLYKGYDEANTKWRDEKYTPTRLGEDTVTLKLVTFKNGKIVPLYEADKNSLALSEISVRSFTFGEDESNDYSAEIMQALQDFKTNLPDNGKYSTIVCMEEQKENSFQGFTITEKKKKVELNYNKKTGLKKIKRKNI
ncbi:MAG: CRISPR-associated helicase Cas3' [Leptospiraceae bacterium]|nr:CRISPR-associated helicase Cas3' [Leptospiraceae bacterium]